MTRFGTIAALAIALQASPASAQEPVEAAFLGVLRGCETWVLDPASWIDGPEPFLAAMDLGERVASVERIPDDFQPPEELRRGNRFWRINASDRAGFALTVSDQLPMCHVVGLGFADFRTAVATVLTSPAFAASWERLEMLDEPTGRSTVFRHRAEERFVLTLSQPAQTRDGAGAIHVIATAVYTPGTN